MSARAAAWAPRLLAALLATLALLAPATPARAADTFTFGKPTTAATYNQAVNFDVSLTASTAPARVEIHLLFPGDVGPFVAQVDAPSSGGTAALHYTLDVTGGGHIMPNTPITSTWVAYPKDGSAPVSSAPDTFLYQDTTQTWQSLQDGIVTVHWTQGPESFAKRAAEFAVKAIDDMAATLGVAETKPLDFFIYADGASFRAALGAGTRENVGGTAITQIRTLFAEFTPDILNDPWVGITVAHELTHQVIDDATSNPYRSLPRWLNEGVAVYESQGYGASDRSLVKDAIGSGDLLPLTALAWQFPTDPTKTSLAYAESVSAVDYLVRTYGKDALTTLILAYKNGPTDDEALTAAIGKDLATFQQDWYGAIGATAPSQFGPQPAPPGPLPSGWEGAPASAAPAGSPSASGEATASGATSPSTSPVTASPAPQPSDTSSGIDMTLVLLAIVVVSAALLAGIVLAGRRAARP